MIRNVLNFIFSILFLIINSPAYSNVISQEVIENYNLKIAAKFSKTYCNAIQFGISKEGSLKFAIGETNKEFLNNKLNKFIDYQSVNKNILLDISKKCQVYEFPIKELEKLAFD